MKIFLASTNSCVGCRSCESVCPHSAITMVYKHGGFLYPVIERSICLKCGLCMEVCPALSVKPLNCYVPQIIVAKNKDIDIRERSSSGGVFYELAKYVINMRGVVFGASFNSFHVEHSSAESLSDVDSILGSKYVQSDTNHSFRQVKELLEIGRMVLYSGTPCQVAGLKKYLRKKYDRLITIDLICHGVPSPIIWEKYVLRLLKRYAADKILKINFRYKKDVDMFDRQFVFNRYYYVCFLREDGISQTIIKSYNQDLFCSYFNRNLFRPSCYDCSYRSLDSSNADFTIGDCWNAYEDHPQIADLNGVSTVVLHTERAVTIWNEIKHFFEYEPEDPSILRYRYEQSKKDEMEERKKRMWKLSNFIAQYVPLEYMRFIYMHDRIDFVILRKINRLWRRIKCIR